MSVVTVKVFGLTDNDTVYVLLSLTLVAIVMSFVWGWLADRIGPKRTLVAVLISWAVGLLIGGLAMGVRRGRVRALPRSPGRSSAAVSVGSRSPTGS